MIKRKMGQFKSKIIIDKDGIQKKICTICGQAKETNSKNWIVKHMNKDGWDTMCSKCKRKRKIEIAEIKKLEPFEENLKVSPEDARIIKIYSYVRNKIDSRLSTGTVPEAGVEPIAEKLMEILYITLRGE